MKIGGEVDAPSRSGPVTLTVVEKRLAATEVQPVHILLRIFEKVMEELLVVAAKRNTAQRRGRHRIRFHATRGDGEVR